MLGLLDHQICFVTKECLEWGSTHDTSGEWVTATACGVLFCCAGQYISFDCYFGGSFCTFRRDTKWGGHKAIHYKALSDRDSTAFCMILSVYCLSRWTVQDILDWMDWKQWLAIVTISTGLTFEPWYGNICIRTGTNQRPVISWLDGCTVASESSCSTCLFEYHMWHVQPSCTVCISSMSGWMVQYFHSCTQFRGHKPKLYTSETNSFGN